MNFFIVIWTLRRVRIAKSVNGNANKNWIYCMFGWHYHEYEWSKRKNCQMRENKFSILFVKKKLLFVLFLI